MEGEVPAKPRRGLERGPLTEEKLRYQAEILENRLRKRDRHLKKWARRIGTDAYRLYDRDIPEIPLALDRYGDAAAGALYERPYEKDEAEEERWLEVMAAAISRALDIPGERIFLKRRKRQARRQERGVQYEKLDNRSFLRDVHEGGLRFRVNLSDYLDTGLFPDRRILRDMVRAEAGGKEILNLFCYTAAFSVYAAAGGAAQVDSVDMSNTYLEWGAVNMGLNGFSPQFLPAEAALRQAGNPAGGGPRCCFIRADALSFLAAAARQGRSWDAVILDPPTFSNSKKMNGALDIRRDYRSLIPQALGLLKRGGLLWFSTNARHFHLEPAEFRGRVPGFELTDLSGTTASPDFRGTSHCYCFRVS